MLRMGKLTCMPSADSLWYRPIFDISTAILEISDFIDSIIEYLKIGYRTYRIGDSSNISTKFIWIIPDYQYQVYMSIIG